MKKTFTFLAIILASISVQAQSNYAGNGKSGFGGAIGNGNLDVSDDGTNITFTLNIGPGTTLNDNLVIYIDSKSGGFDNTNGMNDQADGGRKSVSGNDGANASEVNFSSGFLADYALVFGSFGAAPFELVNGGDNSLVYVSPVSGAGTTVTLSKSSLGITGTPTFKLVGTFVSTTAYRSNEALVENIGDGTAGGGPNYGFSPISFSTALSYPVTVLSVSLINFDAAVMGGSSHLNWKVSCTSKYVVFDIQESADGEKFNTVHSLKADALRCFEPFNYTHKSAIIGKVYYRIKMTTDDGDEKYSWLKTVDGNTAPVSAVQVWPNTVQAVANIQLFSTEKENYTITVYDVSGQRVYTSLIKFNTAGKQSIALPATNIHAGVYQVIMQAAGQRAQVARFIKF